MKMLMLVFNEAMDDEVMEALRACGARGYTRLDGVFGQGRSSGTHLGTDIWPGRNNLLLLALPDDEAAHALECARTLRAKLGAEGIKAFVWNLEAVT